MNLIQRCVLLSAILGFIGCGDPPSETGDDNPPSTGNIWQIGDPSSCTDKEILKMKAADACMPYGQKPGDIHFIMPCLAWYIGIGGPFSVEGSFFVSFRCR